MIDEAADVLLALDERPVGHEHVASPSARSTVAVLGGCRPPVNTQAPAAFISSIERVDVAHDRLQDLGRRRRAVGLVDAEQVLRFIVSPLRGRTQVAAR